MSPNGMLEIVAIIALPKLLVELTGNGGGIGVFWYNLLYIWCICGSTVVLVIALISSGIKEEVIACI
jgi:hypothetical protein